LLRDKTKSKTL